VGLVVAFFIVASMIIIHQQLNKDKVMAYLNRHIDEVQTAMLMDL
jgi:hypothetical protein